MILVGNKIDLNSERVVSFEEGRVLAERNYMMFFDTSAKDGINVNEIFLNNIKEIYKRIEEGYYDLKKNHVESK